MGGRSLRVLPGRASWPFAVPIVTGEHITSWLARLACRYRVAPRDLLIVADPDLSHQVPRVPSRWPIEGLAALTGQPAGRLRSAICGPAEVEFTAYLERFRRPRPSRVPGSGFCPLCLGEAPVWPASWQAVVHRVCVRHRCALVQRCPGCGYRPRSRPSWLGVPHPAWRCPSRLEGERGKPRTHARWCQTDLRLLVPEPVDGGVVAAQAWLLDLIDQTTRAPATVRASGGLELSAAELLEVAFEIITEVAGPPGAHPGPEAVLVAHQILSVADPVEAASRRRARGVLQPGSARVPITFTGATWRRPRSASAIALTLSQEADHLSVATRLAFRTGPPAPCLPPPAGPMVGSRLLPQQLWPGLLGQYDAIAGPHSRALLSIALAKLGNPIPLSAIAVDMGLPAWMAGRLNRFLSSPQGRTRLLVDLERVYADLLAAPPPIDYRRRRTVGADYAQFGTLVKAADCDEGWHLPDRQLRRLARLFWETFTGSDPRYWPQPGPPAAAMDVEDWERLELIYARIAGVTGEPLAWAPT